MNHNTRPGSLVIIHVTQKLSFLMELSESNYAINIIFQLRRLSSRVRLVLGYSVVPNRSATTEFTTVRFISR